jgi:predicted  nucleic acid-binding Zn-ribbon protein
VPVPRRPSPEVTSLIERLRKLVAERRRLEQRRDASRELLERRRREIERLQQRLANLVKRELPT